MNVKSGIAAAALALVPMLSHANVVYEWTAINDVAPHGITLRMEFDDSFQGGPFEYTGQGDVSAWLPPELGLISFSFGFPGAAGIHFTQDTGSGNVGPYYQFLRIDLGLGEYLTGSIEAGNFETGFKMRVTENDNVFEITELVSDALVDGEVGCTNPQSGPCAGARGVIRRVNEVPEPGTLALFGAGLFAASRIRERKRRVYPSFAA